MLSEEKIKKELSRCLERQKMLERKGMYHMAEYYKIRADALTEVLEGKKECSED